MAPSGVELNSEWDSESGVVSEGSVWAEEDRRDRGASMTDGLQCLTLWRYQIYLFIFIFKGTSVMEND